MNYYIIRPDAAAEPGPNTVYISYNPDRISHMHFMFNRWPCDGFIEAFPCYGVSDKIKNYLSQAGLTGLKFEKSETGFTDYVEDRAKLDPPIYWKLESEGSPCIDDFGYNDIHELVVSQKVKDALEVCSLQECEFEQVK